MPKKLVKYDASEFVQIVLGFGALVKTMDHDSELVSNTKHVLTSAVIKYDGEGCFETLNSLYIPVNKPKVTA